MKTKLFPSLFIAALVITFSVSCKKASNTTNNNNNNNNNNPVDTSDVYIKYDLNGVTKIIGGFSNEGSGSQVTEAFIGVGTNFSYYTLDFGNGDYNGIYASDILGALNQKLDVADFNTYTSGAPWAGIRGLVEGVFYNSEGADNSLPGNYVKFTNIHYERTIGGLKEYTVRGEFNVNVRNGSTIKNLTNGRFKVVMDESY